MSKSPRFLIHYCALLFISLGLTLGLIACRAPKPPESAATLRAADLPAEVPALQSKANELFKPQDPVALENVMVVCDKILSIAPDDFQANWQWARAAFWLSDAAGNDKSRRAYWADRGSKYAARAIALEPKRVEGHYYRGLDLGYLARTRTIGAVELIKDIYNEAKASVVADEKFDYAGPHRLLGGVLISAPGWPASVGDSDEGADELKKAVELSPDYPLNHFYYGEALLKTDKPADAEKELNEALRLASEPDNQWMKPRLQTEIDEQMQKVKLKLQK